MAALLVDMAVFLFFFNDTATTEIYTLSLHDALPISGRAPRQALRGWRPEGRRPEARAGPAHARARAAHGSRRGHGRSEEHTSELQSPLQLVWRLLLEKQKAHFRIPDTATSRRQSSAR